MLRTEYITESIKETNASNKKIRKNASVGVYGPMAPCTSSCRLSKLIGDSHVEHSGNPTLSLLSDDLG